MTCASRADGQGVQLAVVHASHNKCSQIYDGLMYEQLGLVWAGVATRALADPERGL